MVQRTQFASMAGDRYRQAIDRELTAFEKREREFMTQERRERAAKFGLPYLEKGPELTRAQGPRIAPKNGAPRRPPA